MTSLRGTVLAAVCLSLGAAHASGITVYSDAGAFALAAGPLSTIGFDGIATAGSLATFPNYASMGVTFEGMIIPGPGVYIIAHGLFPEYNRDFLDSIDSFQRGTPAFFNISLPAGMNAVGFNIFSVTEGVGFATDTETISVNGQDFVISTLPYNGQHDGSDLAFFGFISTSPVASFTVTTGNLNGNTGVDLEHFQFGTVASTVPEPASAFSLGGGLLVALVLARQCHRIRF